MDASQSGNPLKAEKLTYKWEQVAGPAKALIADPFSAISTVTFKKAENFKFKINVGNHHAIVLNAAKKIY